MVTQFQLVDSEGKIIAVGEIDNGMHRVFYPDFPNGYAEFEELEDMFAKCGGVAIQPMLFETPARTRQLDLFGNEE